MASGCRKLIYHKNITLVVETSLWIICGDLDAHLSPSSLYHVLSFLKLGGLERFLVTAIAPGILIV